MVELAVSLHLPQISNTTPYSSSSSILFSLCQEAQRERGRERERERISERKICDNSSIWIENRRIEWVHSKDEQTRERKREKS